MADEKRLIDANALIENADVFTMHTKEYGSIEVIPIDAIGDAPTVDAVEVVHGEWSTIEDEYCGLVALHCSVCNQEWWFEEDVPIKHYHYCPNCGAKMDGGNDK